MIGNEQTLIEISDILDSFDIVGISRLLDAQINSDYDEDVYTVILTDLFQPLYYNYNKLKSKKHVDEEILEQAEHRYMEICKILLNKIFEKFNIKINEVWIDENYTNLPIVALTFYRYFILNFTSNLDEFLYSYVIRNSDVLAKTFEGVKNKKDASTISNKKILSPEMSIVASNIYDIILWVIDHTTTEEFLNNPAATALDCQFIKALYEEGNLSGDFIEVIRAIMHQNINIRSTLGFNIIFKLKDVDVRMEHIARSSGINPEDK